MSPDKLRNELSWCRLKRLAVLGLYASCFIFSMETTAEVSPSRQGELLHLLYQDCGSCHGMTLKGGLGPSILPGDLTNQDIATITATILHGRPTAAMPPWKGILSEEEARWLAEQLKTGVAIDK